MAPPSLHVGRWSGGDLGGILVEAGACRKSFESVSPPYRRAVRRWRGSPQFTSEVGMIAKPLAHLKAGIGNGTNRV